jgi:hypothetical protein
VRRVCAPPALGALLIAAWRGDAELAADLFTAVTAEADRHDQGYHLPFAEYARCVLAVAECREYDALESLCARFGTRSSIKFALPDAIEAGVRSGQLDTARSLLSQRAAFRGDGLVPGEAAGELPVSCLVWAQGCVKAGVEP